MVIDQASLAQSYSKFGSDKPADKKSGGLFSHLTAGKKEQQPEPAAPTMQNIQLRDFSRRLRLLEERFASQRKNVHVMEHNMITEHKKLQQDIRTLQQDFDDLKKQLYEMKQQFDLIGSALRDTAKREDVIVLEKYINLWEPLQFVTRGEVERLIDFVLEGKKGK
jgi:uncharacterized coiled-coil protein SlyX